MTTKLYVGDVSFNVTQAQLRDLFLLAGEVTKIHLVEDQGISKGFAFVYMATEADSHKALERFDGYLLDECPLRVRSC